MLRFQITLRSIPRMNLYIWWNNYVDKFLCIGRTLYIYIGWTPYFEPRLIGPSPQLRQSLLGATHELFYCKTALLTTIQTRKTWKVLDTRKVSRLDFFGGVDSNAVIPAFLPCLTPLLFHLFLFPIQYIRSVLFNQFQSLPRHSFFSLYDLKFWSIGSVSIQPRADSPNWGSCNRIWGDHPRPFINLECPPDTAEISLAIHGNLRRCSRISDVKCPFLLTLGTAKSFAKLHQNNIFQCWRSGDFAAARYHYSVLDSYYGSVKCFLSWSWNSANQDSH